MATRPHTATTTILFTDLVSSTELLQRVGDESAQRILQAHHRMLQEAVAASGGHQVKWLGDGLMVAFPSAADAARCAIAMQQASRRPTLGERLEVRVGLNVGEALREETDYFGTPVVVARRLCDRAEAGQILCSSLVAGLLSGRQAFTFRNCGQLELKGIAEPVEACEVLYDVDQPAALLVHTPFVGRSAEVGKLSQKLGEARAGHGGLVMLVGEPGIGKTRLAEECAEAARKEGTVILWGRCYEGEWAPPYGPFAEAISEYSRSAGPRELRHDLGAGAGPIARVVPELRNSLPDIPEPASLQPDEERFRLLDAVSQFLIGASMRAPVVLVLDDLHWADRGTIAMLRHVARFAPRNRILLLGAYRDVELDRQHPLADALAALRRETNYERILLKGLDTQEVGQLLASLAEQDVPDALVSAISAETDGNPFFIREVLAHLVEEGKIYREKGQWTTNLSIAEMGIPEGVRQVIGRRVSRLSEDANRLLTVASAFNGLFPFDIAASVAGLEETAALDAVDESLAVQLLKPGGEADTYDFTHALIRHTLYGELSPSRQVRLHRQIAEAMERSYGDPSTASGRGRAADHAAEVAYQYHRSAALPGAERGVVHALAAADRAEAAYACDESAVFLRIALDLLPAQDQRRHRLLGRLGLALGWALDFDEALKAASKAGHLIAESEGADAAADYLAEAVRVMVLAGFPRGAWALAEQGVGYAAARRDRTWAWLMGVDLLRQEAEDPDDLGIPLDRPERREVARIVPDLPAEERAALFWFRPFSSREDVLTHASDDPVFLTVWAGEFRRSLPLWQEQAVRAEQQGQIAWAVSYWANAARCHNALGDFAAAQAGYDRALALAGRLAGPSPQLIQVGAARFEMDAARLEVGWEDHLRAVQIALQQRAPEYQWVFAAIRATAAAVYARLERTEEALHWLGTLMAPLERAPGWAANYTEVACLAVETLWLLERTDHIEVIERNLLEKVVEPDFRYPMQDSRRSMACLCALQGRYDEAVEWFARARAVLEEQGARPLRAITDLDEAMMYIRRGAPGDRERASPLLDAALQQFRALGMTGWTRRAESL
jgi:class 3 adenylate cyclase/tetratricopeptide (TPR) repeat protein